jgi:hypothetical protein
MAMQKRFAAIKPGCAVRSAMMQINTLFTPAIIHPCHRRRPTRMVERTVRAQEM